MTGTTRPSPKRQTLNDRIQALPQELQDIIRDYTLDYPTTPIAIMMSYDYRPPINLQINRAIRSTFASTYYTNTTFHSSNSKLLTKFVTALSPEHRDLLESIRLSSRIKQMRRESQLSIGYMVLLQQSARSRAVQFWLQLPEDVRMDVRLSALFANYARISGKELMVEWITAARTS